MKHREELLCSSREEVEDEKEVLIRIKWESPEMRDPTSDTVVYGGAMETKTELKKHKTPECVTSDEKEDGLKRSQAAIEESREGDRERDRQGTKKEGGHGCDRTTHEQHKIGRQDDVFQRLSVERVVRANKLVNVEQSRLGRRKKQDLRRTGTGHWNLFASERRYAQAGERRPFPILCICKGSQREETLAEMRPPAKHLISLPTALVTLQIKHQSL